MTLDNSVQYSFYVSNTGQQWMYKHKENSVIDLMTRNGNDRHQDLMREAQISRIFKDTRPGVSGLRPRGDVLLSLTLSLAVLLGQVLS